MAVTNPLLLTDFYKVSHPFQYPKGTELVVSNLTARKSRIPGVDHVVFFGLRYFIKKYLIEGFEEGFFKRPKWEVMAEYKRMCKNTVGDLPSYDHIADLHDLGYLPITIESIPEGCHVNIGVPMIRIYNTDPAFGWLTNAIESLMSAAIWMPITAATLANQYRELFEAQMEVTGGNPDMVPFMGHDFAFRGMEGVEGAILSGMGHLTSFCGTDTIPAIMAMEKYYGADIEQELVGTSVPATEHSVMSVGTATEGEFETFKRLITETYPSGIVSIVSDTFDLWKVLTDFMPRLKDEILARDGTVVIRPDSGDPVGIICGDPNATPGTPQFKGVYKLLDEVFDSTENDSGFYVLNPKVGAIYGDSITVERAAKIGMRLMNSGFVPNMVYGIGSYTYQYNTRDTFGMAVKATYCEVGGQKYEIYKDPVTDDGTKKSLRGVFKVTGANGNYKVMDGLCGHQPIDALGIRYLDGADLSWYNGSLADIRRRVKEGRSYVTVS